MKNKFFFLFVLVGINANAKEIILECDGTYEKIAIKAPKSIFGPGEKSEVNGKFIINDDSITEVSDSKNFEDAKYQLCSKSSTDYSYALDCRLKKPMKMINDFIYSKSDELSEPSIYKKMGRSR